MIAILHVEELMIDIVLITNRVKTRAQDKKRSFVVECVLAPRLFSVFQKRAKTLHAR